MLTRKQTKSKASTGPDKVQGMALTANKGQSISPARGIQEAAGVGSLLGSARGNGQSDGQSAGKRIFPMTSMVGKV
jgi:hypothetical protein